MTMSDEEKIIERLFDAQNRKSVLAACLRELRNTPDENVISRCFCVFSALDLLAQMHTGKSGYKRSAKKTVLFYRRYMQLNELSAELLYQVRNAVTHSFGTHSQNSATKRQYRFIYDLTGEKLFEQKSTVVYRVNRAQLEHRFFEAIQSYKRELLNSTPARKRFFTVYRRIGETL